MGFKEEVQTIKSQFIKVSQAFQKLKEEQREEMPLEMSTMTEKDTLRSLNSKYDQIIRDDISL